MSRNPEGRRWRKRERGTQHSTTMHGCGGVRGCPVPRNVLISAVADIAGVGERNAAVLRMLDSASALAIARKAVDEAISSSRRSSECQQQMQYSYQTIERQLPQAAGDGSTEEGEQALDVRVAGDCARTQDEQQAAPGDVVFSAETVQPSPPHTDAFDQADALLRVENVGSHALLHVSRCLGGLSGFEGVRLLVKQPLDCETRHAAVMAALLVLLSSLRSCVSLNMVDISLQELQRTIVRECLWWRGCRFRRCPESVESSAEDAATCERWKALRSENIVAVRTALLMAHHPRLGARSWLRTLPLEVMALLLDKAAPAKFDLCLKL